MQWLPGFLFFISLTFHEIKYERMDKKLHLKNFQKVFKHIFFNNDRMLLISFLNLIIWGLSSFIAIWLFQKYWQENNVPLTYFGIIWAIFNLSVGIVGKQVHSLEKKIGPVPLIMFLGLAPICGYFGMGLIGGYFGVALGILFYFSRGVTNVLLKDAINWRTASSYRATTNSLQSFFFRLGFAVVGPGVGYLVDRFGIRFTLITLGWIFLSLFVATIPPLIKTIRKTAPKYIPGM